MAKVEEVVVASFCTIICVALLCVTITIAAAICTKNSTKKKYMIGDVVSVKCSDKKALICASRLFNGKTEYTVLIGDWESLICETEIISNDR